MAGNQHLVPAFARTTKANPFSLCKVQEVNNGNDKTRKHKHDYKYFRLIYKLRCGNTQDGGEFSQTSVTCRINYKPEPCQKRQKKYGETVGLHTRTPPRIGHYTDLKNYRTRIFKWFGT